MEGSFFFLFTWILWIITTFFVKKENKYRTKFSCFLLLFIILSPFEINWNGSIVSILLLAILICVFGYVSAFKGRQRSYMITSAFFMMLAYSSFQLMSIIDPVWLLFRKEWMLGMMLILAAILLQANLKTQILLILLGSVSGEILFAIVLKQYGMFVEIGSLAYFDSLLICIIGILTISYVKDVLSKWEQHIYIMEKEKQKLS